MPLPAQRSADALTLEEEIRLALHASRRESLFCGGYWDVADAMAAIMPIVRDALMVRSLVTEGGDR